jgi:hypothetical protein
MLPQSCLVSGDEVASLTILPGCLPTLAWLVRLVVLVAAADYFID